MWPLLGKGKEVLLKRVFSWSATVTVCLLLFFFPLSPFYVGWTIFFLLPARVSFQSPQFFNIFILSIFVYVLSLMLLHPSALFSTPRTKLFQGWYTWLVLLTTCCMQHETHAATDLLVPLGRVYLFFLWQLSWERVIMMFRSRTMAPFTILLISTNEAERGGDY